MKNTQFTEGNTSGKGRPKGSPNRTTHEMREAIKAIIDKQLDRLEEDLSKMTPRNRWDIVTKLSSYVIPTLTKNDNHNISDTTMKIMVEYVEGHAPDQQLPHGDTAPQLDAPTPPTSLATPMIDMIENQQNKGAK